MVSMNIINYLKRTRAHLEEERGCLALFPRELEFSELPFPCTIVECGSCTRRDQGARTSARGQGVRDKV